jgi:iron complex outermembrane receptor protein
MRPFFVIGCALSLFGGAVPTAKAQGLTYALSDRAPRFLLASSSSASAAPRLIEATAVVALRRRISLELRDVTVETALAEISRKGGIKLAYSKGLVPLNNRVQLQAGDITVAGALIGVLLDTRVDVLLTGAGQAILVNRDRQQNGTVVGKVTDAASGGPVASVLVTIVGTPFTGTTGADGDYRIDGVPTGTYVISARRLGYRSKTERSVQVAADRQTRVDLALEATSKTLDQVVVTGTVVPTERRQLPSPITVVTAEQIDQQNLTSIDQIFRTLVPGGVQTEETPGLGGYTSYSVRGTSALGAASTLKVLIDGVEVEDPAYINNLDPTTIDHVEVISGPEASTIYGSGALSGVMQIFTKHGAPGQTGPAITATTSVGMVDSRWNPGNTALRDNVALSATGGTQALGYNVGGSLQHLGAWIPYEAQTATNIFGGGHFEQGKISGDLTLRYRNDYDKPGNDPASELYGDTAVGNPTQRSTTDWGTYALRVGYKITPHWQTSVTLGFDGFSDAFYTTHPPIGDTVNSARGGDVDAHSIAYNTSYEASLAPGLNATFTAGGDYTEYSMTGYDDEAATYTAPDNKGFYDPYGVSSSYRQLSAIEGYYGQAQFALKNQYFMTLGLHADNSPGETGTQWSPRIGVSYVHDFRAVTMKARFSYGSALVAPTPGEATPSIYTGGEQLANPGLQPNRQRGYDTGLDFFVGDRVEIGGSYYNQVADNLIDLVFLPETTSTGGSVSQYQNIGKIRNYGWEFSGAFSPIAALTVTAEFGSATSTLEQVSPLYTGDFRVGDQLTEIPKWTGGATVAWRVLRRTTLTGSLTHRATWKDVDFVAFYAALFGGTYAGSERPYWINYPAWTKFNVGLAEVLTPWLTGFVQIDNAGNSYAYERINLITPMGRITTVGLKWHP